MAARETDVRIQMRGGPGRGNSTGRGRANSTPIADAARADDDSGSESEKSAGSATPSAINSASDVELPVAAVVPTTDVLPPPVVSAEETEEEAAAKAAADAEKLAAEQAQAAADAKTAQESKAAADAGKSAEAPTTAEGTQVLVAVPVVGTTAADAKATEDKTAETATPPAAADTRKGKEPGRESTPYAAASGALTETTEEVNQPTIAATPEKDSAKRTEIKKAKTDAKNPINKKVIGTIIGLASATVAISALLIAPHLVLYVGSVALSYVKIQASVLAAKVAGTLLIGAGTFAGFTGITVAMKTIVNWLQSEKTAKIEDKKEETSAAADTSEADKGATASPGGSPASEAVKTPVRFSATTAAEEPTATADADADKKDRPAA